MPFLAKRSALVTRVLFRICINVIDNALKKSSSRLIAQGVLALSRPFRKVQLVRRWVDEAQVDNPLASGTDFPKIDLTLATASKDFRTAQLAVSASLKNSMNQIGKVLVVVDDPSLDLAREMFREPNVTVLGESEFLPASLLACIEKHHPIGRKGWITQQVIGILAARESDSAGVLVLDADTVFIRPIAFLSSNGKQLLQFSHEYVSHYEEHALSIWGKRRRHKHLSYVTHYQLMQPGIVREMFPKIADLENWLSAGNMGLSSPIADYHSYGRFLVEHHLDSVSMGRWGNKRARWEDYSGRNLGELLELLQDRFSFSYSVSFHSYLDRKRAEEREMDEDSRA